MKNSTIVTTPRENQNSLGYTTRNAKDEGTYEVPAVDGAIADQSSLGGTGGTTVAVTDSSGSSV